MQDLVARPGADGATSATVIAIMANIDPANLPLLNGRLTQLRRRKEHLQADLRAAKAASRDLDEKDLRLWARERIGGLADAMAGRRNEHVRRVLVTYIDEIVIDPRSKTGVMRDNAGLAALVAAGRVGVHDSALRPERANGRPRNADDRPEGRSWASGIAGSKPSSNKSRATKQRHMFAFHSPPRTQAPWLGSRTRTPPL